MNIVWITSKENSSMDSCTCCPDKTEIMLNMACNSLPDDKF